MKSVLILSFRMSCLKKMLLISFLLCSLIPTSKTSPLTCMTCLSEIHFLLQARSPIVTVTTTVNEILTLFLILIANSMLNLLLILILTTKPIVRAIVILHKTLLGLTHSLPMTLSVILLVTTILTSQMSMVIVIVIMMIVILLMMTSLFLLILSLQPSRL